MANVATQSDVLLYFLAIFLPPVAVFLKTGCDSNFFINILLTILGWIPGCLRKCALSGSTTAEQCYSHSAHQTRGT